MEPEPILKGKRTKILKDPEQSLVLEYSPEFPLRFRFKQEVEGGIIPISITARGLGSVNGSSSYPPSVVNFTGNPNLSWQYVEVGAGLGQFVPYLTGFPLENQPIIIDPAPYQEMRELLDTAQQYVSDEDRSLLEEITRRCDVVLDPLKVRLINRPLHEALQKHPELREIADVVVDNHGATEWGYIRGRGYDETFNDEMALLKHNGLWLNDEEIVFRKKKRPSWRNALDYLFGSHQVLPREWLHRGVEYTLEPVSVPSLPVIGYWNVSRSRVDGDIGK